MKSSTAPFELFETPPYCPNPDCPCHDLEASKTSGKYTREDSRKVGRFPYVTKRWKCKRCGKVFSDSFFYPFYRDRKEPTYEQIFHYHNRGESRRALAEDLKCSLDTVQRRFRKLARQGFLIQAKKTRDLQINESVAYDGIENFAFSQYDPNNINHAIGRETYFLYDFNFTPINRKGRMSARQINRDKLLANRHGRYPSNGIQKATERLFTRLLERTDGELQLHTDNHYAYRRAIRKLKKREILVHNITPAKVCRNYKNRLFAINHADNLTRQQLTTFKRETIAFSKHSIGMIESFSLFMVWKNFMRTCFKKKQVRDPDLNSHSPAMKAGIESRILEFREFFGLRLQPTQVKLSSDWENFVYRRDPSSRRVIASP
jgi:transposase-like protein